MYVLNHLTRGCGWRLVSCIAFRLSNLPYITPLVTCAAASNLASLYSKATSIPNFIDTSSTKYHI